MMEKGLSSKLIIKKLQALQLFDEPLRFINTYQGMPVNQLGKIISCGPTSVRIKTSRTQLVALQGKTNTFFEIDITSAFYKATIQLLNRSENIVELNDFSAAAIPIGLRSTVRINTGAIAVYFMRANRKKICEAQLIDLSLFGMALMVQKSSNRSHPLPGDILQINFELPVEIEEEETLQKIACQGTVKTCFPEESANNFRLGIATKLILAQEQLITHFILQRQIKLIRQIRDLSEETGADKTSPPL